MVNAGYDWNRVRKRTISFENDARLFVLRSVFKEKVQEVFLCSRVENAVCKVLRSLLTHFANIERKNLTNHNQLREKFYGQGYIIESYDAVATYGR